MRVRFTPRAVAEVKRIEGWWRQSRRAAPGLLEQELKAGLVAAPCGSASRDARRPLGGGGRATKLPTANSRVATSAARAVARRPAAHPPIDRAPTCCAALVQRIGAGEMVQRAHCRHLVNRAHALMPWVQHSAAGGAANGGTRQRLTSLALVVSVPPFESTCFDKEWRRNTSSG